MDVTTAGLFATALPLAGIFAKISSGFISERLGSKRAITTASAGSAVLLTTLVILPAWTLMPNLLVLGLVLYSFSPVIYSSTTSSLPSELKSIGLGMVTMFGNIIGAFSTSIVGALIDSSGYVTTFVIVTIVTLISGLIIQIYMREEQVLNV
jgi:sugar phosphate permease